MNAASSVIPPVPLFYRHLQIDLSEALRKADQDYNTCLCLLEEQRRASLVGHTDGPLEWENNPDEGPGVDHRIQRLDPGVGEQHVRVLIRVGHGQHRRRHGT